MGKFDKEETLRMATLEAARGRPVLRLVATAAPAIGRAVHGDKLRALVRFAISQGYYELWNKPAEQGVRPCSNTDSATDRGSVSR